MELQTSRHNDKASTHQKFNKGDVVEIMGIEDGEEDLVIGIGKVDNVEEAKLHGVKISEGCVLVEVRKSSNDEYILYAPI